jgi:hypothetical protein
VIFIRRGLKVTKENILEIINGLKILAKNDFDQLDEYEKDECNDYHEGYLEALNMVHMYFKEKLK